VPTIAALTALLLLTASSAFAQRQHPLDPLVAAEYDEVRAQLTASGHVRPSTRFPLITLEAPEKADLLRWEGGGAAPARIAKAIVKNGQDLAEARIDLTVHRVVGWRPLSGVEAPVLFEEWTRAQEAALADPRFTAALAKRGVTDPKQLFCAPWTMGYFGIPADQGMRLLKVGCFDLRRSTNNVMAWPIEGLYAIVDLGRNRTVRVYDSGPVPIASQDHNFTEAAVGTLRDPVKPVTITLADGGNVTLEGHEIAWQNWRFHYRIDRRQGPVVSLVRDRDHGRDRPILHEGAMAEMFVPYMDPDFGWYSRTYFDMGEYGVGLLLTTLHPGIDCPASAHYESVTVNDDQGKPIETPNAVCLFERTRGDPSWRHSEIVNQTYEGRPAIELVVRAAATIGNYDYVMDWVFNQAGEIEVLVGATGINSLKGVAATSMTSPTAATDTRYGTLVAPNLVSVYHDHFFNFRLDFDVDGTANRFERDVYRTERLPPSSPRRSIYRIAPTVPATESSGRFDAGPTPSKWRIVSAAAKNAVGNPTSYELVPMSDWMQLLTADDYPLRRAGFTKHLFWVTPYAPAERHAAGDYVFASKGDDGLPAWTGKNRPIRDTDIVVWHTVGMHHMPRSEDVPVMPLLWGGFKLRPFNFFDRNPALDLRSK
jgi:primary-amine oxidase